MIPHAISFVNRFLSKNNNFLLKIDFGLNCRIQTFFIWYKAETCLRSCFRTVYKGWPIADYLNNFKISGSHTPCCCTAFRMPAGNRARLCSQTHDFWKFHAPTLRGIWAFSTSWSGFVLTTKPRKNIFLFKRRKPFRRCVSPRNILPVRPFCLESGGKAREYLYSRWAA